MNRGVVVLVVDDHPDTREMYVEFLGAKGLRALQAATCAEALATIAAESVDAVVLDRRLPDGDGGDVCRALRSDPRTRSLPVVMLSGKERDESVDADAYLMKPVAPDALFAEVTRLVAKRHA